ncbi:MAG: type III pantothenate kinase [bacterium]
MNLCIDIGNSNTVIGLFSENELINRWRIATNSRMTRHDILAVISSLFGTENIKFRNISTVVISSVVPMWNHSWERFTSENITSFYSFISPEDKNTGIKVLTDNPAQLGADRVANAMAAKESRPGQGVVVVDSGTAITIDVISPAGEYSGGVILPGLQISIEALSRNTAKLPRFELRRPESALGRNTVTSLQSGMYYGYSGMVDRIVNELKKELSFTPFVIATGGLAGELAESSSTIETYERDLTIKGLNIFAKRIRRKHVEKSE